MIFIYVGLGLLAVIFLTSLLNALSFPRLQEGRPAAVRKISVLIPARNEALHIQETVARILGQDYPDFEVILLDDRSTDRTAHLALQAADGDQRLRVIHGQPLPSGWTGKNWACHQLGVESQGEILVFTDADVRWAPEALSSVAAQMENNRAGMLTVWPTQMTGSWTERLVVPLIMLVLLGYLPEILVRFTSWSIFAAANGQCLAFERSVYGRIGGHLQVKGEIVEDVALARAAKSIGARLVMVLGRGFHRTRMYSNWQEVRQGFGKNILAGHGGLPGLLLISTLMHWFLFLIPWIWLFLGGALPGYFGWPAVPLLMIGLGVGARLVTAIVSGQRVLDAFLMPVSVVLMTVIAVQALWWHYREGGPRWKGRTLLREI